MANKYLDYNGLDYFWDKIDNKKQNKLTAGSNITISGSTISASQPTVNNGRLTIQKNGSNVQTFTANQSGNVTADIVTDELKRKSDTRSSMKPSDANFASSATLHFTTVGALDSQTQSGGYADALMLNSWSNDSGGRVNALVATKQSDQKLYHYTGTFNGSSWSGKKEVAYTDAIPTKVSDLTNDSGFVTSSGTVAKANQLTTVRTIGISGGATGTATSFNGTANISIPITDVKDAYVTWGGKSLAANITPDDMGCIDEFGHNKLAFLPAECVEVKYSTDGGSTWVDYGMTNASKIKMLSTTGATAYVGGSSNNATASNIANLKLRVRIACGPKTGGRLYTAAKKLLINVSTQGAGGSKVDIKYRTIANYVADTETWSNVGTFDVAGGSGWNSIPFNYTWGGSFTSQTSQIGQFEFVFYSSTLGTWGLKKLSVIDFRLIGSTNWSMPSELARAGHLYTIDENQNATFPGQITATKFNGPATSATYTQYLEGNGRINSADIAHAYPNSDVHQRLDIASASMVTNKPASDGFINTYMWDNSGAYDTQLFLPNGAYNNDGRPQLRYKADTSTTFNWSQWKSLAYLDDVPTKTSDLTNDSNFPVDASYVHTDNNFTTTLKNKLGGIATGAEVNQNAFSNVKVGSTTVAADSKTDTLELVAGSNVTLTPDATNDKVTIAATVPTVNNGTLTIQKNGSNVATFTANQSGNSTANIVVPTKTSDITNDSGYLTSIPKASASTLGGIKVGNNLTVSSDGTLSANASSVTVDSALSSTSTNPVQNKVINTALNGKQHTLTAGSHIDITNNVIKAKDYVHSESPVTTGSVTPVVTNSMITNGTITADKFATGAVLKLTMSTTDIGEGAALAANTLYGVYD